MLGKLKKVDVAQNCKLLQHWSRSLCDFESTEKGLFSKESRTGSWVWWQFFTPRKGAHSKLKRINGRLKKHSTSLLSSLLSVLSAAVLSSLSASSSL